MPFPIALSLALLFAPPSSADGARDVPAQQAANEIALSDASAAEKEALAKLQHGNFWPSRALALMRLERFDCEESALMLSSFLEDKAWQVRSYAYAIAARRGLEIPASRIALEQDALVVRTILRARLPFPSDRLASAIGRLSSAESLESQLLALELSCARRASRAPAATTLDPKAARALLAADRQEVDALDALLSRIVMRMTRAEAGVFSPRLAAITAGADAKRDYRWREWLRKHNANPGYEGAFLVAQSADGVRRTSLNAIARLDAPDFVQLEVYLGAFASKSIDLAILIDCTASMSGELAEAQAGADDLLGFLTGCCASLRTAIAGYRDTRDRWELSAFDFTSDASVARKNLWSLTAEGGGDEPESLYRAMKETLTAANWRPDPPEDSQGSKSVALERVMVIIGDAPPHVGEGTKCEELAKSAATKGMRIYTIQAHAADAAKDVKWFPEIALAGGGRSVRLGDEDSLIAEIAQLTLGDRFHDELGEFFNVYRSLCR
ncbi:MAG: hypothetical protein EXS10_07530 [Phycisphaerales bacterium]|nr:hypothetical protein [Phycisphaerales bacterium]